jgi:hypothetical protein
VPVYEDYYISRKISIFERTKERENRPVEPALEQLIKVIDPNLM